MFFRKKELPSRARSTHSSRLEPREAVFSYHANRSIRTASDIRNVETADIQSNDRHGRTPLWRYMTPVFVLILIIILLGLCTQLNGPVKVVLVGNESQQEASLYSRSMQAYQRAADSYFATFSNHNKLTVNTSKIVSELESQFPEIDDVSIGLPLVGTQPAVYIQLVTPKLILVANNGTYLLDGFGRVLAPVTKVQLSKLSSLKIPVVNDQSGLIVKSGQIILPESTVEFITEVAGQLQANNVGISSMTLPAGEAELDVHVEGKGYYVKYNIYGNAREEAGTYLAVAAMLKSENKSPSQYIDVRVANRAYYK
jgi:hypothetical protein